MADDWRQYIVSDPEVIGGKPAFQGTRLSVELVLDFMAAGWERSDLYQAYPFLTAEMLNAADQLGLTRGAEG